MRKKPTFKQGRFTPRHPEKYKGDITNIIFRSSWEQQMNIFLDNNPNILEWASEPFAIPYIKPTTGKVHRYFPDYWIKYQNNNGKIVQEIIEVKPDSQVNIRTKRRLTNYDKITYAINIAKWKSCQQFCEKHNIKFRILTEKEMFRT